MLDFYNAFFDESLSVGFVHHLYFFFGATKVRRSISIFTQYLRNFFCANNKVTQDTTKLAFHVLTIFVDLCFENSGLAQQ